MSEITFTKVQNTIADCTRNFINAPGKTVEGIGQLLQNGKEVEGLVNVKTGINDLISFGAVSTIESRQRVNDFINAVVKSCENVPKNLLKSEPQNIKWEHNHSDVKKLEIPCEAILTDPTSFPVPQ